MQTTHADRQTRARGIVVALYRGKVVTLYRGKVVTRQHGGAVGCRPGGQGLGGSPRAHARAREAESWRKLAGS